MRSKRPFRSLIVCVSCAMVGCILASTAYSRRVDELEIERDIYASRFQNWQTPASHPTGSAWPENVMKPLTNSKPR